MTILRNAKKSKLKTTKDNETNTGSGCGCGCVTNRWCENMEIMGVN